MPPSTDIHAARVLIVDDQPSNVRLLEHTLRRGGYTDVTSTIEPREVEGLHLANPFDLILLDLQMPHMNGFQVMQHVRAMEGGDRVAILVMSADPSLMLQALQGGGNSFLSKPFVLAEVLARVEVMLEKLRAARPSTPPPPPKAARPQPGTAAKIPSS